MIPLPDVNALVALLMDRHVHHGAAREWFASLRGGSFATTSITQTGFVRVASSPALASGLSVAEATAVFAEVVARADHVFLPDDAGYVGNPLVPHDKLVGHRQVTDAHLVGLARRHAATVVTLDRALQQLAPDDVLLLDGEVDQG